MGYGYIMAILWPIPTNTHTHNPHGYAVPMQMPNCVPIKLVNHTVVYSAGVGSVVFNPVIKGWSARAVESTWVLNVPNLWNNLLSVLYLTHHSGFVVNVNSSHMAYCWPPGIPIFMATINDNNATFLNGTTKAISQYANPATSIPLNLALWHCRLSHYNLAEVKALIEHKLVIGIKLDVRIPPDPVCEPCLAGKMHANSFPSSE